MRVLTNSSPQAPRSRNLDRAVVCDKAYLTDDTESSAASTLDEEASVSWNALRWPYGGPANGCQFENGCFLVDGIFTPSRGRASESVDVGKGSGESFSPNERPPSPPCV